MKNMKFNVRLEIGNYCNLKCPLCIRERGFVTKDMLNNLHLSLDDVKKFLPRRVLTFKTGKFPVKTVILSGAVAEPTLNPECIEIVEYLSRYVFVVIDSNGSTRNVDWWGKLGQTGVECGFGIDSIKPNNNKYRINSNTNKVIENMKAFAAAGGKAKWKYLPYKHNEDEQEEQQRIAESIGAEFVIIQPRPAKNVPVDASKQFPEEKNVVHYVDNNSPHYYCKLFGTVGDYLIEISPEGIVYPCCMTAENIYCAYKDYFISGDTRVNPGEEYGRAYKVFKETIVPLIEDNGGITSLSLHHHRIEEILGGGFYQALVKSWENKYHYCKNKCKNGKYEFKADTL